MIKDDGYYAIRNDGFGPGLGHHGFMVAKAKYVYVSDGKKYQLNRFCQAAGFK